MKLNADIIYENLSRTYDIKRFGQNIQTLTLEGSFFADKDTECLSGRVYIAEARQRPERSPDAECLILYIGDDPPDDWRAARSCLFAIIGATDATDTQTYAQPNMFQLHNAVQDIYERYGRWSDKLRAILDGNASISEMISVTAPLLENSVALCNNRIEVEVVYDAGGNLVASSVGPVSEQHAAQFQNRHAQNTAMREPFLYKIGGLNAYCINIYKQDNYLGLIVLGESNRQFRPGDMAAFRYFHRFVSEAAEKRMNIASGQFVTVKSVLGDILGDLPVSAANIRRSLEKESRAGDCWACAAVKLTVEQKQLPAEYLCALLESRVPGSIALYSEPHGSDAGQRGYIALFLSINSEEGGFERAIAPIGVTLSGLSMCAGVSYAFNDIAEARHCFRQAVSAIEAAEFFGCVETLSFFRDFALLHALKESVGKLQPEHMLPTGLLKLRKKPTIPGSADYWATLRAYLDNEMNMSETAKQLFVHRSTLQTRIAKIKENVDLSSPFKRMYVRYCLYLMDSISSSSGDGER